MPKALMGKTRRSIIKASGEVLSSTDRLLSPMQFGPEQTNHTLAGPGR